MILTSTYPTDRILEVSDGHQTISVAVAHAQLMWEILQRAPCTEMFYSQGMGVWSQRHGQRFDRDTRNVVTHDGHTVTWQVFYRLPYDQSVRKEVCWSRAELSRVLRAAVVASRLTTHTHVEGRTA